MKYMCEICDKKFNRSYHLKRHFKTHGVSPPPKYSRDYETMEFFSLKDFLNWKEDIEVKTLSSYIKARGRIRKPNGDVYIYYYCCHSSVNKSKGKKIEELESAKIRSKCSARIIVKIRNDRIYVQHFTKHNNHGEDPSSEKTPVAGKLRQAIPVQSIIEDIHDSLIDKLDKALLFKQLREQTSKDSQINKSHRLSSAIANNMITRKDSNSWIVKSQSGEEYIVLKNEEDCLQQCNFTCNECNICIHSFVCSCVDKIRYNICKHIHGVVRQSISSSNGSMADISTEDISKTGPSLPRQDYQTSVKSKIDTFLDLYDKLTFTDEENIKIHKTLENLLNICSNKIK